MHPIHYCDRKFLPDYIKKEKENGLVTLFLTHCLEDECFHALRGLHFSCSILFCWNCYEVLHTWRARKMETKTLRTSEIY